MAEFSTRQHPTVELMRAKLLSQKVELPEDATAQEKAFADNQQFRTLAIDPYGATFVSLLTNKVYTFKPEDGEDPTSGGRFRFKCDYETFVAKYCNSPSNGSINEALIDLGLI
jgi:hypothetical protein